MSISRRRYDREQSLVSDPGSASRAIMQVAQDVQSHWRWMATGLGCGRGADQERGRSEVVASRADNHRFVSESLLHEPGTSRSRVDNLPNLWSTLMLNQCRSHIKINFNIGSYAPAGHTRNSCRTVAEIMAPSKMRSINPAYRPGVRLHAAIARPCYQIGWASRRPGRLDRAVV
jgi:hypothetical protein